MAQRREKFNSRLNKTTVILFTELQLISDWRETVRVLQLKPMMQSEETREQNLTLGDKTRDKRKETVVFRDDFSTVSTCFFE